LRLLKSIRIRMTSIQVFTHAKNNLKNEIPFKMNSMLTVDMRGL
jgi:hypothetical protein